MIQTAAIIWAVLATTSWAFEVYRNRALKQNHERQLTQAKAALVKEDASSRYYRSQWLAARDEITAISRQRSEATRRGNCTRAAKRKAAIKAAIRARAEQIRKEIGR